MEAFEELFVKMTQIEYIASLSWQGLGHGNLYQNCILGGLDREGLPADNETSLAILQAQIQVQMTQPTLSVWYAEGLSDAFSHESRPVREDGRGIPRLFQPEDLHRARTSMQRPARGTHPGAGGDRWLHRADAPGDVVRHRPAGVREPR